jgi:hypothetical protein
MGGAVTPVGVTSQVLGKFKNLDQCKAAGNKQGADGATADLIQEEFTGIALTWGRDECGWDRSWKRASRVGVCLWR